MDLCYNEIEKPTVSGLSGDGGPYEKYRLLIWSLLLLFASFAAAWYNDHLFNHLFVLIVPIYITLFVVFVSLLVMSIWRIIKRKELINVISIAVLALLVIMLVCFPFRDAKVKYELNKYDADRMEVIEMIKNDELRPKDEIGNIVLPAGFRGLSSDGEAFLYQNEEEGQVVGFWIFRGIQSGSIQLVYSTGGETLIWANETPHPITKIEKLKENWYYVETDY